MPEKSYKPGQLELALFNASVEFAEILQERYHFHRSGVLSVNDPRIPINKEYIDFLEKKVEGIKINPVSG